MSNLKVTARVTLQLEIETDSRWDPSESVKDIRNMAVRNALHKINKLLEGSGSILHPTGIRQVGNPSVHIVTIPVT